MTTDTERQELLRIAEEIVHDLADHGRAPSAIATLRLAAWAKSQLSPPAPVGEPTPPLTAATREPENLRMDAYYYGFASTGVGLIDRILSAVACAGKAYHHTFDWSAETEPYEKCFRGECPIDWIQNAANHAAFAFHLTPKQPSLGTEQVSIPVLDGEQLREK